MSGARAWVAICTVGGFATFLMIWVLMRHVEHAGLPRPVVLSIPVGYGAAVGVTALMHEVNDGQEDPLFVLVRWFVLFLGIPFAASVFTGQRPPR